MGIKEERHKIKKVNLGIMKYCKEEIVDKVPMHLLMLTLNTLEIAAFTRIFLSNTGIVDPPTKQNLIFGVLWEEKKKWQDSRQTRVLNILN